MNRKLFTSTYRWCWGRSLQPRWRWQASLREAGRQKPPGWGAFAALGSVEDVCWSQSRWSGDPSPQPPGCWDHADDLQFSNEGQKGRRERRRKFVSWTSWCQIYNSSIVAEAFILANLVYSRTQNWLFLGHELIIKKYILIYIYF